jgi:hypothetical protein
MLSFSNCVIPKEGPRKLKKKLVSIRQPCNYKNTCKIHVNREAAVIQKMTIVVFAETSGNLQHFMRRIPESQSRILTSILPNVKTKMIILFQVEILEY